MRFLLYPRRKKVSTPKPTTVKPGMKDHVQAKPRTVSAPRAGTGSSVSRSTTFLSTRHHADKLSSSDLEAQCDYSELVSLRRLWFGFVDVAASVGIYIFACPKYILITGGRFHFSRSMEVGC